ncbi:MAG: diguanylate cyclase [Planctomycetes bacterium]|nr:diguanylate cyclase [Planctomycetota bacterium]
MTPTNYSVFLVDDDPAILRLLGHWLEKAGYTVRPFDNGEEALEAIESQCPDFLITDWEMPGMNGLELCRRVRQLDLPHYVHILFLTVRSSTEETVAGLEVGADDFLSKPIDLEELLARLRSGARVLTLERRLSLMAQTDPLTGLLTRRTFFENLEKEWSRATRHHVPLSVVMLDIDFFKRINDVHGHPAGDAVLKTIAELLKDGCRTADVICRYGGEEFCAVLPETNERQAAHWADRVRRKLASHAMQLGDREFHLTGSFGVAERLDDTQNAEQLVDLADQALLCAKQSGRDRVVAFQALNQSNDVRVDQMDPCGMLFYGVTARHVMTSMVVGLRKSETIGRAAKFFLRSRTNSAPVVDDDGKLVGMLSEKDLMAEMISLDSWNRPVGEVMKPNVICYEEDAPIRSIYEFLCRVSIRRVVIVKDGRPIGTISRGTLLRWFSNLAASRGLVENETSADPRFNVDAHRSRECLVELAQELSRQAIELGHRCGEETDDLVPYVVGGATRMQELVNDLLSYSGSGTAGGTAVMGGTSLD